MEGYPLWLLPPGADEIAKHWKQTTQARCTCIDKREMGSRDPESWERVPNETVVRYGGKVYRTLQHAADENGVKRQAVRMWIRNGYAEVVKD